MLRALAVVLAAVALLTAGTGMAGEWTAKDVQKVLEKKKDGKAIFEAGDLGGQVVRINAGAVAYYVDLKTELCFAKPEPSISTAWLMVPCSAVKKGFPSIAALITWEP